MSESRVSRAPERLFYLDNVRAFLAILVIASHVAITYGLEAPWYFKEGTTSPAANLFFMLYFALTSTFMMSLFFFIAGYFAAESLSRKGPLHYLAGRLPRLLVPWLIYNYLINPFMYWADSVLRQGTPASYWHLVREALVHFRNFGEGPLWFVLILLFFSCAHVLLHLVARIWRGRSPRARPAARPGGFSGLVFILALASALALIRVFAPGGGSQAGMRLTYLVKFACFFGLGISASGRGWLEWITAERTGRRWRSIALIALMAWPVIFFAGNGWRLAPAESIAPYGLGWLAPFFNGFCWQTLAFAAWESLIAAAVSISLLSWFKRRLNQPGRLSVVLARNAYAVYIIHAPIIVLLAYALHGIGLHPLLKFLLVSGVGISVAFAIAHYLLQRLPLANRVI